MAADTVASAFAVNSANNYVNTNIQFTNQSAGATVYTWDFGDGTTSSVTDPTHAYAAPGTYVVRLAAENQQCMESSSKTVTIEEEPVSGISNDNISSLEITGYTNKVTVAFEKYPDAEVTLDIFDVVGRKIIETMTLNTRQPRHLVQLDNIISGYYFVKVSGDSGIHTKKVFLSGDK
jgi:PKD repeat protein